jgi:RNA polymerase primary sigma factor
MHFEDKSIDIIYTGKGEKLAVKKAAAEWGDSKSESLLGLLPMVSTTGDPVKMYLREMGLVSLLSREGEIKIAKEIEEGAQESMEAVFSANISIKEVVNIGAQLKSGGITIESVVDNLNDEDGNVEEEIHRNRVVKLLDKVTVYDTKNNAIRKKLNAKGLNPLERQKLKEDLDKNLLNIVKTCRKVRFNKQQIDRMVINLRAYLNEGE